MADNGSLVDTDVDVSGETEASGTASDALEVPGSDATGSSDSTGTTSSQPRSADGRFTKAEAKRDLLSTEADTGDEPTADASLATPAGTTEVSDAAPAALPPVEVGQSQPAATDAPKYEKAPWSVMSDREPHTIEGAVLVKGHGVLIPEANLHETELLISRGLKYNREWRNMRELQESLREQANAPSVETIEARALLAELKPLMQNADAFGTFMADPEANLEAMLLRVEHAITKAENERLKKGLEAGREQVSAIDAQETMATEFQSAFDAIANHEYFRGKLPADQLQAAFAKLNRYHQRFFRDAERDMPEYGVKQGERILEQQVIIDELADRLDMIGKAKAEQDRLKQEAKDVAEAERRNKEKLGAAKGAKATAPVARATTGTPSQQPAAKLTGREAKRSLMDEEYDSSL